LIVNLSCSQPLDYIFFGLLGMRSIGVISDTHRLVRPEALKALEGVEQIIHAGDIGSPVVLEELCKIAPVTAIRGNVDVGDWAKGLPETAVLELGEAMVYVIHDIKLLDLDPRAAGFSAIVCGHSHVSMRETHSGILYFNPGSAGPRRFHLPASIGYLTVSGKEISGEIVTIPG
jgi:uncharacterized protein